MNEGERKFPVAREGWPFILPLAAVTAALWSLRAPVSAGFLSLLTFFVVYFFRDPERKIPPQENAVLSPADGKVLQAEPCREERFLKGPAVKIGIFMSPLNVHVNRIPLTGRVIERSYHPGKFISANREKASLLNEQNALLLESGRGARILFIQIAGFIARRIVCRVSEGDWVVRGQRFGMIRFGSRLDVYLPENTRIQVRRGQRVFAGKTILGTLP